MHKSLQEIKNLENELHLKQLQVKSLLAISQAINNNIPAPDLFNMYRNFLGWEMGIQKMALFIRDQDEWICAAKINAPDEVNQEDFSNTILKFKRTERIDKKTFPILASFDVIIPVYHKDYPISFVLIGECEEGDDFYNKIQFITTITNITSVAIENKRLFNQQIAQERLNREMELASEVQHRLIPDHQPVEEGFELASIYKPHFNIGGDYFDYIPIGSDKVLICIADISGKGISAALLMSNFQAFLQSAAAHYTDLDDIVRKLNTTVQKITNSERFLTLFIMEYNKLSGDIKYINAGHHAPFLISEGKIHRLDKGCTVIGALEELPFVETGSTTLTNEALLFMYTDGLTDLKNDEGDFLDEQMLSSFLVQNIELSPTALNNRLMTLVDEFKENQEYPDDIAILTGKMCPVGILN